jgi:hypothetical protein
MGRSGQGLAGPGSIPVLATSRNPVPPRVIEGYLAISDAEVGYLSQHFPTHCSLYPASRKLCILTLPLCPYKEAPKLLGRYTSRPRSTERVEEEVALPTRCHDGAAHETQGLLGGMVAVQLLSFRHGRDVPDGGDLGSWVWSVYEVVVEGVAGTSPLARPQ